LKGLVLSDQDDRRAPRKIDRVDVGGLGALFMMSSYDFVRWTLRITPEGMEAGIPENGGLTGEFTWRWVSTELANALEMDERFNVDVPGSATFKRYDDGWRIVSIDASSPSPY
jgi:hypothetical protein